MLTVTVDPDDGYELETWNVEGLSTPTEMEENKYTVKVTAKQGEATPSLSATLRDAIPTYEITTNKTNISCTVNGTRVTKAHEGDTVVVTVTLSEGEERGGVTGKTASGDTILITENNDGTYSFTMPAEAVVLNARIIADHTIEVKNTSGVASYQFLVDGVGTSVAKTGDTVEIVAVPEPGRYLSEVYVYPKGGSQSDPDAIKFTYSSSGPNTFEMPEYDVYVRIVAFRLNYTGTILTIPPEAITGTTITSTRKITTQDTKATWTYTVLLDQKITEIIPPDGYHTDHMTCQLGDGEETPFTLGSVLEGLTDNITIRVYLEKDSTETVTTIGSLEDLAEFRDTVNTGSDYSSETVTLTADLELPEDWTPIGTTEKPFTGAFDGQNHTITMALDTDSRYVGLFGCAEGATIQNLTVAGSITSTTETNLARQQIFTLGADTYVGGVLACGEDVTITNCHSSVNINAKCANAGGIAGSCSGTITGCTNTGDFRIKQEKANGADDTFTDAYGTGGIGGIVGAVPGGNTGKTVTLTMEQCSNSGSFTAQFGDSSTVTSTDGSTQWAGKHMSGYFGGLVGLRGSYTNLTIRESVNTGSMTGAMRYAGGLVGGQHTYSLSGNTQSPDPSASSFQSTVTNCYSTGYLHATEKCDKKGWEGYMGGLFGRAGSGDIITNCYVSVKVQQDHPNALVNSVICGVQNDELWMGSADQSACYGPAKIADLGSTTLLSKLTAGSGEGVWKNDVNGLNGPAGAYPLLAWQSDDAGDETYKITFQVTPEEAEAKLTVTSGLGEECTPSPDGTYELKRGAYTYTASAKGYKTIEGSFNVSKDAEIAIELQPASVITFVVSPATASLTLQSGSVVAPDCDPVISDETITYVYTLVNDTTYTYDVYAEGYTGLSDACTPDGDATIEIKLNKLQEGREIYGDKNPDTTNTITEGGTYIIGRGGLEAGEGTITIATSEAVTLAGDGVGNNNAYYGLFINCTEPANLTLQDVYIRDGLDFDGGITANIIDFQKGSSNRLSFAGLSILDMEGNAVGYAAIHVPTGTSLTISGGTAYLYKYEQGAGIGGNGTGSGGEGQAAENNGTINIENATLFIKGSKQGAVIGTGSGANQAGPITISNSNLHVIANARGAAIGGGAGSKGASGGDVTITNSTVTINVNYSGAAIGGGGAEGLNDAPGGTLTVSGSSIRAFSDLNAAAFWQAQGITDAGVNGNKTITATVNGGNQYVLEFDTAQLSKSASSFTVKDGDKTIYNRGLHSYSYVQENTVRGSIQYTMDNWGASGDTKLYLYVTGENHTLDVNGEKFTATWDEKTETFTVEKAAISTADFVTTVIEDIDGTMTATTTLDSAALADRLKDAEPGAQLDIEPKIPSGTTVAKTVLRLPGSDLKAIADSGVTLHAGSPVAEITLSNTALKDVAGQGGGEVTISAAQGEKGITIEVAADGKALTKIDGGLRVTVPVENPTTSTVLVVVNADGTQTVLDTTVGTDYVSALVDGSCTIKVVDQAQDVYTTEVRDGVATTTFDSKLLAEYLETLRAGTQFDVVVSVPPGESITKSVTILSSSDADAMVQAGVSLHINSPVAGITLSNAALQDAARQSGKEITITAAQGEKGITIEVAADGNILETISGGLRVSIPVANPSKNTVLVLVHADGTETVLDTTIGTDSVSATVDGSCVIKVVEQVKTVDVLATTEVEDGKATTTIDSDALAEALKEANASTQLVITVEVPEGEEITQTTTQLTRGDVGAIADTKASLKLVTPLADISLPNKALQDMAGKKGQEAEVVTITAAVTEQGTRIEIAADGQVLEKIDGGLKVSLPAAGEDLTPGSVLVLVDGTGKETVIKKSVAGEDHVTGLLDGSCTIKVVDNTKSFQDVSDAAWYADAAAFASSHELISGVSEGVFDPNGQMTRAMLVTVLHRLEDTPDSTTANIFGDVEPGTWYTGAVLWANETGIVNGVSEGVFAPNDSITREQLATFLYRYAGVVGLDTSARDNLSAFQDTGKISDWASDAMQWAVKTGLVSGKGDGILDPGGTATRAEVATILQRLMNLIVLDEFSTPADTGTEYLHPVTTANGTATTTVDSALLNQQLAHSAAGAQITITAEYPANTSKAVTVLTRGNAGTIADAKSSLNISTPLAGVVLSHEALQALAGQAGQKEETVTITAAQTANGTAIEVAADGTVLDKVPGGLLVTLPVEEAKLTPGSVLVLVDADGRETILKKSAVSEHGVTALVDGSCTVKVVEGAKSFQDVSKTDWFADAAAFASSHELFSGTSEGVFEPNGQMTRAMLVTVLHRLEDTPGATAANAFGDVDSNAWYAGAVLWANENNLVNGTSEGVFEPEGNITREQLAAILYRYAGALGLDTSAGGSLNGFTDAGKVSGWASDAMEWAVETGLISGKGGGVLDPGGTATRAEVAAILQRMVNLITAQ